MFEYTNTQIKSIIDEHIHNERDRSLLKRRLVDGATYEKLSYEFDLSVRQVKYIIYKQIDYLEKFIKE